METASREKPTPTSQAFGIQRSSNWTRRRPAIIPIAAGRKTKIALRTGMSKVSWAKRGISVTATNEDVLARTKMMTLM